jgi:hypothetical protein
MRKSLSHTGKFTGCVREETPKTACHWSSFGGGNGGCSFFVNFFSGWYKRADMELRFTFIVNNCIGNLRQY